MVDAGLGLLTSADRNESLKRAARVDSFLAVENRDHAVTHLLALSIVGDKRNIFLFQFRNGEEELYVRHNNMLNGRGGWVSENASVTASYIHTHAVVMGGAEVRSSNIGAGVVVRPGQEVCYATLEIDGLLRR